MTNSKNVLLIVCDQLRADFLSCYGGPDLTPNIDRLAAQSVVFDRAWTPTPVCVPARMTLLTGMHGLSCPVQIPESVTTLPVPLREAGYHTAGLGKFHLVPPRADVGFDEMILAEDTGTNMVLDDYHPELARSGDVEWAHGLTNHDVLGVASRLAEEKTVTRWNGDHAVRYLAERAENDAPFYGVVSFLRS